ncbi:bacterial membrane protein YfhO [Bellilinea caldifistulae]|uniref:YfhO family protein n=1 Tax=Bellilinea caldifistulae TaxID=360411 RepID=A0A0P6XI44_9CHLR|nr:hypothetical protein AC812_16665 [Bellilinea caldifistulae]GAP10894.1 bacterial membrane protein YfhO [Bellilinea caldifistulae]
MIRKKFEWLILVIPLIPWLIGAEYFFYPRYSGFSDLTITHLPNAIYLLDSIKNHGTFPFWSTLILGGYPFAANPLAGLWYPPGWLAYIFPYPTGFNILVMLHLFWGAVGIKRFLVYQNLRREASILGALAFLLMPKLFAHFAAGHITLIYAVCWTPWLVYNQMANQNKSRWLISAGILGLIALADVRWVAYAVLLWAGWLVYDLIRRRKTNTIVEITNQITEIPLVFAGALLLASVLLLPLLEYTHLSTRSLMNQSDIAVNSLPFEEILGLWIPDFGGFAEWVLYPGALVFCLAIYSISIPGLRKKTAFWWLVVLLSLLLSLGNTLPFFSILSTLPGMDLLRVPTRFYFLGGMGFAILAAWGLHDLLERENLFRPDPVFFMTPFAAFTGFFGLGFVLLGQKISTNLIWGFFNLLSVIFLIALVERKRHLIVQGVKILILLLIVDLSLVNQQSIQWKTRAEVFSENPAVVEFLKSQSGEFRIYSPSYSIPQHIAALQNIKMVNGVDPLILNTFQEFFIRASGIPLDRYSVTLPPFPNDDPKTDNRNYTPDLELMSLLGVRFIVSEFDIPALKTNEVARFSESRVYENPHFIGLAWIDYEGERLPVDNLKVQPNKLDLTASGPGRLFVSHVYYPGWMISMDGQPVSFTLKENLFPVINLPNGEHTVQLEFRPRLVFIGLGLSIIAWLCLVLYFSFRWPHEEK